jgi:hypothetical protein
VCRPAAGCEAGTIAVPQDALAAAPALEPHRSSSAVPSSQVWTPLIIAVLAALPQFPDQTRWPFRPDPQQAFAAE